MLILVTKLSGASVHTLRQQKITECRYLVLLVTAPIKDTIALLLRTVGIITTVDKFM
jgi:hypothetical protein